MGISTSSGDYHEDAVDWHLANATPSGLGNSPDLSQNAPTPEDVRSMTHTAAPETLNPGQKVIKNVGESAIGAVLAGPKLLHDVMSGEIDPSSEEGIKKATDVVSGLIGGGSFGSEMGAAGIFGGRLTSATKAAAESLEKLGVGEQTIKKYTGLERGAEGLWRKEYDDSQALLTVPTENATDLTTREPREMMMQGDYKLGDILHHPELYKDYPELKDMPVQVMDRLKEQPSSTLAVYFHGDKTNPYGSISLKGTMPFEEAKGTLAHEVQHAVQANTTGMSIGHLTNVEKDQYKGYLARKIVDPKSVDKLLNLPEDHELRKKAVSTAQDLLNDLDYKTYLNLAHEQEAWNTARRVDMTAAERKRSLGKDKETAPRGDQIKFKMRSKPYL